MQGAEVLDREDEHPTGLEWWFGYIAVMATALIPALGKFTASGEDGASSTISEVVWSIVYIWVASRLFASREATFALLRRSAVLWCFVALMVVSTLWSVSPSTTLRQSIELVGTTAVATYFVLRYSLRRLLALFGLAFASVAALSLAFVVLAPIRGRMDWGGGAWSGIFQEKNLLGAAMVLAIITLTALLFSGTPRRLIIGAALALCALLLVESHSATAYAAGAGALALGIAARLWWSPRARPVGRLITCGIGLFVLSSLATWGFHPDSAVQLLGRDSSLTGRADFWPYLVQAVWDRPVLGYGYNGFFGSDVGKDYLGNFMAYGFSPWHAHNSFLMTLLDAGFVGAGLLVVLALTGLIRAARYLSQEHTFLAAWPLMIVLYLLIGSYTETYLANYNTFEWIFFVAALLYPIRSLAFAQAQSRSSASIGAPPFARTAGGQAP